MWKSKIEKKKKNLLNNLVVVLIFGLLLNWVSLENMGHDTKESPIIKKFLEMEREVTPKMNHVEDLWNCP